MCSRWSAACARKLTSFVWSAPGSRRSSGTISCEPVSNGATNSHFLKWLFVAPFETGSQDIVPLDRLLPGALQTNDVNFLAQAADHLLHIKAGLRIVDAVEEHSLLHRRQRIAC